VGFFICRIRHGTYNQTWTVPMKLEVFCVKCFPLKHQHRPDKHYELDIQDKQVYSLYCEHGHTTSIGMQQAKFELLFELGCNAAADGYFRESITSFTVSLERFYEFFIQTCLFNSGLAETAFENCWKEVSRQSERQLGAYISLYTLNTGKTPQLSKMVDLRNNIVHKGYIPSRDEAIKYGQHIYDLITGHDELLKSILIEGFHKANSFVHTKEMSDHNMANGYSSSIFTLLDITFIYEPKKEQKNVGAHIQMLEQVKKHKSRQF